MSDSWFTNLIRPIAGFPGIGKTTAAKRFGYQDSDSSLFSRKGSIKHPDWPRNYLEHIQSSSGIIFISTHPEVRAGLVNADIPYLLVYPDWDCKEVYLRRYKERGSSELFIEILNDFWDEWLSGLDTDTYAFGRIVLKHDEYLEDVLLNFKRDV